MSYLHEKNIIHCDLALRNLLVSTESQKYLVKVADFGMSKTITNSGLYSRVNENETLPIKWTAIEVLVNYTFIQNILIKIIKKSKNHFLNFSKYIKY